MLSIVRIVLAISRAPNIFTMHFNIGSNFNSLYEFYYTVEEITRIFIVYVDISEYSIIANQQKSTLYLPFAIKLLGGKKQGTPSRQAYIQISYANWDQWG